MINDASSSKADLNLAAIERLQIFAIIISNKRVAQLFWLLKGNICRKPGVDAESANSSWLHWSIQIELNDKSGRENLVKLKKSELFH